jgi:glycosyltransferase involved in cell wall biosynthesis
MKWYYQTLIGVGVVGTLAILIGWDESKRLQARIQAAYDPPPYRVHGSLVSVIIPALEEENYLPNLLTTLANQTYEPIEVIVADSSSSPYKEATQEICRAFGATYLYVPKLNVSLARNEGAQVAKGDILVFIDADCELASNYIEEVVSRLDQGYLLVHGADPLINDGLLASLSVVARAWLKPNHWTSGRGIGIRQATFWELGAYDVALDPTLGYREDLDLGRRVAETYGYGAIDYMRIPLIAEDARRVRLMGSAEWTEVRGVRNGRFIPV